MASEEPNNTLPTNVVGRNSNQPTLVSTADLLPVVGISRKMQAKLLSQCNIYDARGIMVKCATKAQREDVAEKVETNEKLVYSWLKQVNLWQLNGMTADMAYLLVQAGVRDVEDLAKVDINKIKPILNALVACQVDFIPVSDDVLANLINEAQKYVCDSSTSDNNDEVEKALREIQYFLISTKGQEDYYGLQLHSSHTAGEIHDIYEKFLPEIMEKISNRNESVANRLSIAIEHSDPVPEHLFREEQKSPFTTIQQGISDIKNSLKDILEIGFVLPLPRVLRGNVHHASSSKPCENFDVELVGVVSATSNKDESDKNPCAITDSDGNFVIILPERYSFKEEVRLVIRDKVSKKSEEHCLTVSDIISSANKQFDQFMKDNDNQIDNAWSNRRDAFNASMEKAKQNAYLAFEKDYRDKHENYVEEDCKNAFNTEYNPYLEEFGKYLNSYRDYYKCDYGYNLFLNKGNLLEATVTSRSFGKNGEAETSIAFKGQISDYDLTKAMPKVKLMGNEEGNVIYLSTDTTPSKVYKYSMLQRLVEPKIYPPGSTRTDIKAPVSFEEMKKGLYTDPHNYPQMGSLGVGYVLNMHQAWVPDGFALGSLLYSLVLAPGEEQRLVVRENKQSYELSDTGEATDSDSESYAMQQNDDSDAAYSYALDQMSKGNSSSQYKTETSTHGWSVGLSGGNGMIGGSAGYSGSKSTSKGSASTSAQQSNSHSEVSNTAQSFQHAIQSAANKISNAKRLSISTATSIQTDSVATKIIANHNHSHAMTVQYWEVNRRYRLETAIDSVDLVLFVPMQLIRFLPQDQNLYLNLQDNSNRAKFDKNFYYQRYRVLFDNYDSLYYQLPYKYRSGLSLMKKYWTTPMWQLETDENSLHALTFKFSVKTLPIDKFNVKLVLKNGKGTYTQLVTPPGGISYDDLIRHLEEKYDTTRELEEEIKAYRAKQPKQELSCTFCLLDGVTTDDISYITIEYAADNLNVNLNFADLDPETNDKDGMKGERSEQYYFDKGYNQAVAKAIINMGKAYWDYIKNNKGSAGDYRDYLHYRQSVPECLRNYPLRNNVTLSAYRLRNIDDIQIDGISLQGSTGSASITVAPTSGKLNWNIRIGVSTSTKILHLGEIQRIEETYTHICTNTLRYSQALWSTMTPDERAMLLEQYLVDVSKLDTTPDDHTDIPLLNCIDVKTVLGFYGNCMIFPFTFPQALADDLGITAAEIQNSLYSYHTNSFRAPTTTISLPTDGMIGEAVLGETNVSEKIDITRFWNWKDSDIDHMDIDSSYLNGTDYLAGKSTKDITALNMNGATAATPVTVPDLVSALVSKQTPTFDNITGLEQTASILNKATESAASGRDKALEQSAAAAKNATDAMKAAGEYSNKQAELSNQMKSKALDVASDLLKNNVSPETLKELGLGNLGELITSDLGTSNSTPNGNGSNTPGGEGGHSEVPPVAEQPEDENPSPEPNPEPIGGGSGGGLGEDFDDFLPKPSPTLANLGDGYNNVDDIIFYDENIIEKYVIPSIPAVSQPNEYACWATVTTLLFYWKEGNVEDPKGMKTISEDPDGFIRTFLNEIDGRNDRYFFDMYDPILKNIGNFKQLLDNKLNYNEKKQKLDEDIQQGKVTLTYQQYNSFLTYLKNGEQPKGLAYTDQVKFFKEKCKLQMEEVKEYSAYDLFDMLKAHGPIIALIDADGGTDVFTTHYVLVVGIVIGTKYDSIIYMDPFAKYDTVKGKVHPIGRIRVRTYDDFAQDFDRARAEAPEAERICRATTNNDPRCHSKNSIRTQLIHF